MHVNRSAESNLLSWPAWFKVRISIIDSKGPIYLHVSIRYEVRISIIDSKGPIYLHVSIR